MGGEWDQQGSLGPCEEMEDDCDQDEGGLHTLLNVEKVANTNKVDQIAVGKGRRTDSTNCRRPSILVALLTTAIASFFSLPSIYGQKSPAELSQVAQPTQKWADPRDAGGFCKAKTDPTVCTLRRTVANSEKVTVSLFGNSYSGYYCWTDYGLKDVLESVPHDPATAGDLTQHELHPKFSMHTLFNSGLQHHVDTFRRILLEEDPDHVVLQDGSLIAMGCKGGKRKDGTLFKVSPQVRVTTEAMQSVFGPAIFEWSSRHVIKNGVKPIVFLVTAWARPEEAFFRAQVGQAAELEGIVEGNWAMKNYEVYPEGVTPSLKSQNFIGVHGESEMLRATLEGLGIYRERLFKGAASEAGQQDGPEFRSSAPFEVAIAPVGVAFHDIRSKVENIFNVRPVPDLWWHTVNTSRMELPGQRKTPTESERKLWPGASERNFLYTQNPQDMPWFGHPTPSGIYLYGTMLKRTILTALQGKNGRHFGDLRLAPDSGMYQNINNLLLDEVNAINLEEFNRLWRIRGARACSEKGVICPGGGVSQQTEENIAGQQGEHEPSQIFAGRGVLGQQSEHEQVNREDDTTLQEAARVDKIVAVRGVQPLWLGAGVTPTCADDGTQNCMYSRLCCNSLSKCYEKDGSWASCMTSCTPGIHLDDNATYLFPWSCALLLLPTNPR